MATRKDTAFLFVPAIIGGIILLAIILLDIQFSNFQQAYFQEVAEETKRNNFFLVRAFRDLLENGQVDKMHRMLNKYHGPNPMIVKIIARGKGPIIETEGVPDYLAEHVRRPEIKGIFKKNHEEDVLVQFNRALNSFMIYHSVRFRVGSQDYALVMASKCNSMTLLMQQTKRAILILTALGILSTLVLVAYFCYWIRSPLNRVFASMSKIAAGELESPIYVPRSGLIREIALCLQTLTEQLKKQIVSLKDGANEREAVLNAMSEAVLLVDAGGKVVRWNRTAEELLYPGRKFRNRGEPECPPEFREYIGKVEDSVRTEKRSLLRGGREFQLLVKVLSFTREGERFFLISATDLTDFNKLEAAQREFIAAISHEMKTPLTGIVGAVDAISNGALDHQEYKERCIETLTTQSERLHTLLLNFLTLTSLENMHPKEESDFLPVQSSAVLRGVMEICRPAAESAGIALVLQESDSLEFPGDFQLLQQALSNLITNAVIHSGTKSIELSAHRTAEGEIDFRVRDHGCGIPVEHRERIFKRFYRIPSSHKKQNGSGIGLAIVKHIALYHHGSVTVEPVPGGGAEFHLKIPLLPGG